jgi:hypothetical protein
VSDDLAARQALVARFLDDPALESLVRDDPARAAAEAGVAADFVMRLAKIPSHRVEAFRSSRAHKDGLRQKMAERGVSK